MTCKDIINSDNCLWVYTHGTNDMHRDVYQDSSEIWPRWPYHRWFWGCVNYNPGVNPENCTLSSHTLRRRSLGGKRSTVFWGFAWRHQTATVPIHPIKAGLLVLIIKLSKSLWANIAVLTEAKAWPWQMRRGVSREQVSTADRDLNASQSISAHLAFHNQRLTKRLIRSDQCQFKYL